MRTGEGMMWDASKGRKYAKDIQINESHSPLLFQFYMERVPKAGEGVICCSEDF